MTEAADLTEILDRATSSYESVLKSYQAATQALIDKWTGNDWSPDPDTTKAVIEAISTVGASAGTGVRLSRDWLVAAAELDVAAAELDDTP